MKREGTKFIMECEEFQAAVSKAYQQGVDHAMSVLQPAMEQIKDAGKCEWVSVPMSLDFVSGCGVEIPRSERVPMRYKFCPNCGKPIEALFCIDEFWPRRKK